MIHERASLTAQSPPARQPSGPVVPHRLRIRSRTAVLGIACLSALAVAAWLLVRFAAPDSVALPAACGTPAVLAHHADDLATARRAMARGFCGLEVDVQWRPGVGLVVAHDSLPDGWTLAGSLTLRGLLDSLPRRPDLLWLDFKNLSPLNGAAAAAHVDTLMTRYGLRDHLVIEARQPRGLSAFRRRLTGVIPAYWIRPRPGGAAGLVYDARLMLTLIGRGIPAISLPRAMLTPSFARRFGRFALFTWTTETPEQTRMAAGLGARIILTDYPVAPPRGDTAPAGASSAETRMPRGRALTAARD